jgi:hypothetical protein
MNIEQIRTIFENNREKLDKLYQNYTIKTYKSIVIDATSCDLQLISSKINLNIIISPSLYWSKELTLNVKNKKEALKFASSVFDFLPQSKIYHYKVFENKDKYLFIAYEPEVISQKIKELGIAKDKIKNIFFAQTEFSKITLPISITPTISLVQKDGIVFAIPTGLCEEKGSFDKFIFEHYFSHHSYSYDEFEEDHIDDKTMITSWILLSTALIILGFNWYIQKKEITKQLEKKEEIIKTYKLANSMAKVVVIKNSLLKKEEKQINLRKKIDYILGINLEETGQTNLPQTAPSSSFIAPGTNDLIDLLSTQFEDKEFVKELDFKNNEIFISLMMKDDKRAEYIKDYLKQKFKIDSIEAKNKIVTAKVKL